MNLNVQLRRLLNNAEISASELARRSGVPKQTISDWMNGVPPRSIQYLKQISDVFHITIDELLFSEAATETAQKKADTTNHLHSEVRLQRLVDSLAGATPPGGPTSVRHEQTPEKILNSLPDLIGYWDAGLRNLYANSAYGIYFGKQPEEIRGIFIDELLGPELYQKNLPYILGALAGESQLFERDIPTPSGTIKRTIAKYLPDVVDGKVVGFSVVVADITGLKK